MMKNTTFLALAALSLSLPVVGNTIQMPEGCTNPDGMAVSHAGALAVAAPNIDRRAPGAVFRKDKWGQLRKWFEVPVHPETGFASPMGVCFGPRGELYVCDNQPDSRGRVLRVALGRDGKMSCETVAEGLENANGVKYRQGRLYVTQAFLRRIVRDDGALASGLYVFSAHDRGVRVSNTKDDPQLAFLDWTTNAATRVGLNGVAVSPDGDALYVGNYGDARIWKLTPAFDGRIAESEVFAQGGALVTPDGLCTSQEGVLYVADMKASDVKAFNPDGTLARVIKSKDFRRPSEPCVSGNALYVANYGGTTLEQLGAVRSVPKALPKPETFDVWPDGKMPNVQTDLKWKPIIEWNAPEKLRSDAVVISVSGGCYMSCGLAGNETVPLKRYFLERGVTVVNLRYRCPRPVGLPFYLPAWQDAQRTVRFVRCEAKRRGLDPEKIGFVGCSAGGHLTLMTALNSETRAYEPIDALDEVPCHVNWAVPVYAAYVFKDQAGSAKDECACPLAAEFAFDGHTPPMCFIHGDADGWSAFGSARVYNRLREMGVPAEMHTFATENHCFMDDPRPGSPAAGWIDRIWEWLFRMEFVPCK